MPAAAGAGEYHGFCTSDISKIDPGFGSPELLRDLVQDAHALNMRVLLDVQVNHVCAKGMKYKANPNKLANASKKPKSLTGDLIVAIP